MWQALREEGWFRQAFYIPLWEHGGGLSLYENLSPERRAQAEVPLDLRRSLGRVLERRIAIEGGGPVREDRMLPIPFKETFRFWRGRWVFESHGRPASLERDSEVPQGGSSLRLTKQGRDAAPYLTQVYLPRVEMQPEGSYEASLWLRAEPGAEVELTFSQKQAPFGFCGLAAKLAADGEWRQHTVRFQVTGEGCTPDKTRLSL
ncbi:MAG: hypothetical protein JNK87_33190, partial [Bryobacterales bacterium]|nr:hypothetical protein [Bryobacterales bacterium]